MIRILDEITARPGMAAALETAYREGYFPLAEKRGMTLEAAWMAPPAPMPDKPNSLTFLWSVPDVPAWWKMRYGAFDPQVAAFWQSIEPMVLERRRVFPGPLPSEQANA